MKKLLTSLFATMLISASFLLAGCTKTPEDFWVNTNAMSIEFKESETNQFLFDEEKPLQWTTIIENHINNEEKPAYNEIKTQYNKILINSVFMFNTLSANLELKPIKTTKEVQNVFAKFDKQLESFQDEINTFLEKKATFEHLIIQNLDNDFAAMELRTFKRAYAALLTKAAQFNSAFENLYTTAYLAFPKISNEQNPSAPLPAGTQKLVATITINKLIRAHTEYIFDENNTILSSPAPSNLLDKIDQIKLQMQTPNEHTEQTVKLNEFLLHNQTFNAELNSFYTALTKINFVEYEKAEDKEEYLEEKNNTVFLEKIEFFFEYVPNFIVTKLEELVI